MGAIGFIFVETYLTGQSIGKQAQSLRTMLLVSDAGRALARFNYLSFEFQATWLETSETELDKAYENLKSKLAGLKPHAPEQTAVLIAQTDRLASATLDAVDAYINGERDKGVRLTTESRKILEQIDAAFEPISVELRERVIAAGEAVGDSSRRATIAATVTVAVVAGVMLLLSALMRLVVTGPLRRTTAVLRAVADGDTKAEVPDTDRGDEIGEIARVIEVFKTNMIENEALQAERIEADKADERLRLDDARRIEEKHQAEERQRTEEARQT